mmetsp:Transcript_44958/g.103755  ORF Transcript_44958/g.103755 Transcript_44958/m.103755 type:complete len:234 (-) Transcript_44958:72-773(-)
MCGSSASRRRASAYSCHAGGGTACSTSSCVWPWRTTWSRSTTCCLSSSGSSSPPTARPGRVAAPTSTLTCRATCPRPSSTPTRASSSPTLRPRERRPSPRRPRARCPPPTRRAPARAPISVALCCATCAPDLRRSTPASSPSYLPGASRGPPPPLRSGPRCSVGEMWPGAPAATRPRGHRTAGASAWPICLAPPRAAAAAGLRVTSSAPAPVPFASVLIHDTTRLSLQWAAVR